MNPDSTAAAIVMGVFCVGIPLLGLIFFLWDEWRGSKIPSGSDNQR